MAAAGFLYLKIAESKVYDVLKWKDAIGVHHPRAGEVVEEISVCINGFPGAEICSLSSQAVRELILPRFQKTLHDCGRAEIALTAGEFIV